MWKMETDNYVNGTPAVSGNIIVFGGCDGIIRIADPLTGKEKDTINIGMYIASSPALYSGKACFGDYDGNFYCVDLNAGKVLWAVNSSEDGGSILGIPAIGYNNVVIGNEDKNIYCYDLMTGALRWKYRTNGRISGSAVIAPGKVLFGSGDGYIYMLSIKDGTKLWSFNAGSPISSSPALMNGRFYILTEDGRLLAFGNK
jgi:outer membrane protein assembly factor BamB